MNWLEIDRLEDEAMSDAEALVDRCRPPPFLICCRAKRPSIVELLRSGKCSWTAEDWQPFFDERAAIAEFDNRLTCIEEAARVFNCCVIEWQNRDPVCSSPDNCSWCGDTEQEGRRCFPSVSEAQVTHGRTAIVGTRGAIDERPRRSLR
jgi:hypothetical protein